MTDWAALFWLKSSFNMHDKRHPSGTFPANSTKSPDKLLFVSSSCHRQQRARFHQSTKAKLSTFDGPSSRFEICSLCAQWAQNKKGQTVQVLGCWNGALTQYYLPYLSCIELFTPLFYVFIVFFFLITTELALNPAVKSTEHTQSSQKIPITVNSHWATTLVKLKHGFQNSPFTIND